MPSVLNENEYNQVYRILGGHKDNIDALTAVIEDTALPKLKQAHTFLDIGAGNGYLTAAISSHFEHCSVIEPSAEFSTHLATLGFETQTATFQQAVISNQYDYVLCSYVLFNVALNEWPSFLDKLVASIAKGGMGTIIMTAPRGAHHEMSHSLNSNYKNSTPVIEYLNRNNIKYSVEHAISQHPVETLEEMYTLCRFIFLEDCFSPEKYFSLSETEREQLDKKIRDYALKQKLDDGTYQLKAHVDVINIVKTTQ